MVVIRAWQIEYYHRKPRALITPASDSQGRCRWVPDNAHYPERDTQFHILNSAQDLLEACRAADNFLDWSHAGTGAQTVAYNAVKSLLRSVLAKVEGEQQ